MSGENLGSKALPMATLGGGCFWCLEACFEMLRGVESVVSGYAGGDPSLIDYRSVCGGDTGHAEVVQIRFDPAIIGYRDLLDVFFAIHDPTTRNRQGADVGTQYRSVIFYHDLDQKAVAESAVAELTADEVWGAPIVTHIEPLPAFFAAEAYHQSYFRSNPAQPYCQRVVAPKAAKMMQKFAAWLK